MDGFNALLYKSKDFGSIKNTARGLAVTGNASLTTISIALILADETMEHKPLVIDGSPDFHNKVMEAALKANLPISQSKMQPKSDFACQHCPNALWFIQNQVELTCFCKLMSLMVWTNSQKKVISMCDGIFQQNEPD